MNGEPVVIAVDPVTGRMGWRDVNPIDRTTFSYFNSDSALDYDQPDNQFAGFFNIRSSSLLTMAGDDTSLVMLDSETTYAFQGGQNDDLFMVTGAHDVASVDGGDGQDTLALNLAGQSVALN